MSDGPVSSRRIDLLESRGDQGAAAIAKAEERRLAAVQVVNGLFRLVKVLRIHTESNQATTALVEGLAAAVRDFCAKGGVPAASVLFAEDAVFVNGQMLRASREVYAAARELGAIIDKCGASEITLERGIGAAEVGEFARALVGVMRGQASAPLTEGKLPGIRLQRIRQGVGGRSDDTESAAPSERILRSYASSVVVVREYLRELRGGDAGAPNRVRRAAQKLVSHVDDDPELLARIAASPIDDRDEAVIAVHSAILAMLMSRLLTTDRVVLASVVASALLFDAAAVRLEQRRRDGGARGEAERDRLPASGVVSLTTVGRIQPTSIVRTVLVFEALWARRSARLGPVYRGRVPATIYAGAVAVSRSFLERMQPPPGQTRPRIDELVQAQIQGATDESERVLIRLLMAALALIPGGTPVALDTGEEAIVSALPGQVADVTRPPVRIVKDVYGRPLPKPLAVDLAAMPARGQPERRVVRVLPKKPG